MRRFVTPSIVTESHTRNHTHTKLFYTTYTQHTYVYNGPHQHCHTGTHTKNNTDFQAHPLLLAHPVRKASPAKLNACRVHVVCIRVHLHASTHMHPRTCMCTHALMARIRQYIHPHCALHTHTYINRYIYIPIHPYAYTTYVCTPERIYIHTHSRVT